MGVIYFVKNLVNGKGYVGQTNRSLDVRRIEHHCFAFKKWSPNPFHRALRKHGADSFEWIVLEECPTQDELNKKERDWIATLNVMGSTHRGYNARAGGSNGPLTEVAKKKISDKNKGRSFHSENWFKRKLSDKLSGKRNPRYIHLNPTETAALVEDFKNGILSNAQLAVKYKMSRPAIYRKIDEAHPGLRKDMEWKRYEKLSERGLQKRMRNR